MCLLTRLFHASWGGGRDFQPSPRRLVNVLKHQCKRTGRRGVTYILSRMDASQSGSLCSRNVRYADVSLEKLCGGNATVRGQGGVSSPSCPFPGMLQPAIGTFLTNTMSDLSSSLHPDPILGLGAASIPTHYGLHCITAIRK